MKPPFVVDGDAHVLEVQDQIRAKAPPPWDRRPFALPSPDGVDRAMFGTLGKQPRPYDPQVYLQDLDVEGIDLAIIFPTSGLMLGEVRAADWANVYCRAYNDWIAEFCAAAPDRLKAIAMVPLQDITLACAELNRAVGTLGLVGAMVPSYFRAGPPNPGERYYDPFYAEAERLDVPVAIHASGSIAGDSHRYVHFLQIHLMSHVIEQMNAVTATVIGGVFERFPNLKVGFMEAGCGWVPFWLEHMDEEFEKRRREVPWLKQKPSEYIANSRARFGVEPEEKLLPIAVEELGADRFIFASDYPHWDSDWPNTVRTLADRTDISDAARQQIMCDNALAFYNLRVPSRA
jgi:predicted TIM-barrel fold metal-dependent hydrolase